MTSTANPKLRALIFCTTPTRIKPSCFSPTPEEAQKIEIKRTPPVHLHESLEGALEPPQRRGYRQGVVSALFIVPYSTPSIFSLLLACVHLLPRTILKFVARSRREYPRRKKIRVKEGGGGNTLYCTTRSNFHVKNT